MVEDLIWYGLFGRISDKPRRNSIVQEYVLPDFSANKRGFIRQPREDRAVAAQQDGSADGSVLYMENERFSVPELLFNPSQIGEWTVLPLNERSSYLPRTSTIRRTGSSRIAGNYCTLNLTFAFRGSRRFLGQHSRCRRERALRWIYTKAVS